MSALSSAQNSAQKLHIVQPSNSPSTSPSNSPSSTIPNSPVSSQIGFQRRMDMQTKLCGMFESPDLEALELVHSAAVAHFNLGARPLYLFLSGPAGSGKTEICIEILESAINHFTPVRKVAHQIDDVTSRSIVSGFGDPKETSLLFQTAPASHPHAIWLIPDFTTILSQNSQAKVETLAKLRKIWDGKVPVSKGNQGKIDPWEGKITIIAATTSIVEEFMQRYRSYGDRFYQVQWTPPSDMTALLSKVRSNAALTTKTIGSHPAMDPKKDPNSPYSQLIKATSLYLNPANHTPVDPTKIPATVIAQLDALAELTCLLRTGVTRNPSNYNEILDLDQPEMPTRLSNYLFQILIAHASMLHKDWPDQEEINLVIRLCMDSIPSRRRHLLEVVMASPKAEIPYSSIVAAQFLPPPIVKRLVDEMDFIGVLKLHVSEHVPPGYVTFPTKVRKLVELAFPKWRPAEWAPIDQCAQVAAQAPNWKSYL